MICPNKNSQEWIDLVAKVGESRALYMWQYMETAITIPDNNEILDELTAKVNANPSFFAKKYEAYLKPIVGNSTNPTALIAAFYQRLANVKGKLNGDVIETSGGNYLLFPESQVNVGDIVPIPHALQLVLDDLSARFNIPFRVFNDKEVPWKGKYINDGDAKVVLINLAHASAETPLHEYYHPFVRILSLKNQPLFQAIAQEAASKGDQRSDLEEVVTSYLASEALNRRPSTFLEMFFSFLRRIFKGKDVDKLTTIGEVLDVLSSKIDLSKESTLTEAYEKMDSLMDDIATSIGATKHKNAPDYISLLTAEAIKYTTSDSSNFYQDEAGNDVALRVSAFVGDKELGVFSMRNKNLKWSQAEWRAKQIWRGIVKNEDETPIDQIEGTATVDGKTYTFKELLEVVDKEFGRSRMYGKMVHSFMQYALEEDPKLKEQARLQTIEYAKIYGEPFTRLETHKNLKPIWDNLEDIIFQAGIAVNIGDNKKYSNKHKDKFAPEVSLISNLLKDANGNFIGTTADGILQHSNSDLSMIDWKTGHITKDGNTPYLMVYGDTYGLTDSRLNRAYLELTIRALIIKEKHPDVTFREIKIIKINSDGSINNMRLDLAPYLATIGDYYKATNKEVYAELVKRKLLDAKEYEGVSGAILDVMSQIEGMPYEDQLKYLKNKLATIHYGKTQQEIERNDSLRKLSNKYTEAILELEKVAGANIHEATPDVPYWVGTFKNLSDISNPKVQAFHKILLQAKNIISNDKKGYSDKIDALHRDLVAEQGGRTNKVTDFIAGSAVVGGLLTVNPFLFGAGLLFRAATKRKLGVKTKDYFAFMWKKSTDPARPGYYMNTGNTYEIEGKVYSLTKAQKAYRDFIQSSMASKYNEFASEIVGEDLYGKPMSRALALGIPSTLPEDFMPRAPKDFQEVREEQNFLDGYAGIQTNAQYHTKQYLTSFIEDEFETSKSPIPLSYFKHTGSKVVESANHTFDVEVAFKGFMANMAYKQQMDSVFDIGVGLSNALHDELDEQSKARYPELSSFVKEIIFPQVLGTARAIDIKSRKWNRKIGKVTSKLTGIPEGTPLVLSQDRIVRMVKSSVTMSVMGFKVLSPVRNAAMIAVQTITQATKRPINRLLSNIVGVPPESFDALNINGASEVLTVFYKNKMFGTEEKSKLWNLAMKFNWLPDDYPYTVNKDSLLSKPIAMSPTSHAFMFYQLGEYMGAMWHLAGLLKGTKVEAGGKMTTLWDAYNDQGEWTAGSRGMKQLGNGLLQDFTELDELEIKNLKRVNEKLNGSYRQEEKTAIETTVIGDFFLQFKKYFYQYLKVLFASEYKDITVGKYIKTGSRPDGVSVYQWHSEVMEGQLMVLAYGILAGVRGKKAFREYLTGSSVAGSNIIGNHRVRAFATAINTMGWLAVLMMAFFGGLDDDDEKSYVGKQLKKIIYDNTRGLHPADIFDTAKKPIIAADRVSRVGEAFFTYMFEGVFRGKENKDGWAPGAKTLLRAFPLTASPMQYRDLFKDYDINNDPLIEIISTK